MVILIRTCPNRCLKAHSRDFCQMTILWNRRNSSQKTRQNKKKHKSKDFWKNKTVCRSSKLSRWSKKWNSWKSSSRMRIKTNKISRTRFCSKSLWTSWRLMSRMMRLIVNRPTCISSRYSVFKRTKPDYMKKSRESANKCKTFRKSWTKRTRAWDLRFKT